jgi:predicted dithiol-disulfide oxidoreductase (DUF899 family)
VGRRAGNVGGPVSVSWQAEPSQLIDRGQPWAARPGEQGGVSLFYRDGDTVLYTYSGYLSVVDFLCGADQYLDLTPLGRQDEDVELRHHDWYAGDS